MQTPLRGVDASLWLVWEVPLFLAAVSVLLSGAAAGAIVLGPRRGAPPWLAPLIAVAAAVLAPVVWEAPGRWPWWYSILWIVAIGLLALEPPIAPRHPQRVDGRRARRDDARLGTHGARARRRGGARSGEPEPGRLRRRDAACSASG